MLKISEDKPNDISTVYAYFTTPTEKYPSGHMKICNNWSVFNNDYKWGKEREFIAALDVANPGKYSHYHIAWCDCN